MSGAAGSYPELRYLLDCLTGQTHEIPTSVNSSHLRWLCEWHGLAPYASISGDEVLIEKTRIELSQSLLLRQELALVLSCLTTNGIKAVPFKGPELADKLYTPTSLRLFGDNDVLVQPKDVLPSLEALKKIGYQHALSHTQVERLLKYHYEVTLFHQDHNTKLEIHWRCLPPFYGLADRDILSSSHWQLVEDPQGASHYRLSPEREWIALMLHAFKDHWLRLINIQDLILLDGKLTPSQQSMKVQLTEESGLIKIYEHTKHLMDGVTGQSNAAFNRWQSYWNTTRPWSQHSLRLWLWQGQLIGGLSGLCLPLRATMGLKETDILAMDLPRGLDALYYAARPWRLGKSFLGK